MGELLPPPGVPLYWPPSQPTVTNPEALIEMAYETAPCGCAYVTATYQGKTTVGFDPASHCLEHAGEHPRARARSLPSWQEAAAPYADSIREWLHEEVRRVALATQALEDLALIPVLAGHPWFLHWLAAQPEWAAYTAHVRGAPHTA